MGDHHSILAYLATLGAALGFGKFLVSNEPLEWRLVLGRLILGSGSSVAAGTIYLLFPQMHPLALIGVASLSGLAGAAWLELKFKQKVDALLKQQAGEKNG